MVFARCCKQLTIPFFTLYGWWELKLRYCPVKVGLRYTDDLNPCSVCITNTPRKGNLLSCSFSIVNCKDSWIEFTWSSNIWTSFWWGQRMNVSSTYLSHIDGFSDVDPNAISLKYSMYMLASTGDNGESIASPSSCRYISLAMCSLITSIPSSRSSLSNRPSTIRTSTITGQACSRPSLILLYPWHFRVLLSVVSIPTSFSLHRQHMALLTSICEHPESTRAVHSHLLTSTFTTAIAGFSLAWQEGWRWRLLPFGVSLARW